MTEKIIFEHKITEISGGHGFTVHRNDGNYLGAFETEREAVERAKQSRLVQLALELTNILTRK